MKTAGIEVAAKTLAVVLSDGTTPGKAQEYANSTSGHQALVKALTRAGVERICLEATGAYHLDLALALDAAGLAVMVVNPKASKRFAEALATRNKTDAVDAGVLSEFAQRMPFERWPPAKAPPPRRWCWRTCASGTSVNKSFAILKALAGADPIGVRELARRVGRAVRAVHADAQRLAAIGLIDKTADGKLHFPYEAVRIELGWRAAA